MVAVISDAYPFSVFPDLTCHLEDMGMVLPDSKETKLGSSNQEAFLPAGKIPG